MEHTASEFLRALRGTRSQVQLARALGYRGNPITDWERGERFPTADEALRAAARVRIDVAGAFEQFAPSVKLRRSGTRLLLGEWLSTLRGDTPVVTLAGRCHCSRYAVSRWLKGAARPRLPDFFRLLDAITGRLPEWVASFVPIERVPSLVPRYQAATAARRLAFDAPWTEAVLRLLETRAYRQQRRHCPGFIAAALGISSRDEEVCLQRLVAAGVVERRASKYAPRAATAVDTQGGKQALHALKRHWTQVAAERLQAPAASDFFAYNVVSLSQDDLQQVHEKLRATFREIRSLVAASRPEEVAAVINLQVVTFVPP
ncbi:MAG TPA: helix-turn-helix transcriptional regulator [Polyangiaceae bacterium]|nr:helix-turn-helix transcriptional regulator [Polyangiaceae bacterium]